MANTAKIADLVVNIKTNVATIGAQFQKIGKHVDDFGKNFFKLSVAANLASQAITKVASSAMQAGRWLVSTIDNQIKLATENNQLAMGLGMSTQAFVALKDSAEDAGIEAESFDQRISKLNKTIGDALLNTTGEAAEAIKKMDLSISDLAPLNMEERILAIADATKKMGINSQVGAEIVKMFGQGAGPQMVLWLNQGSAAIREQMEESKRMGVALDDLAMTKMEIARIKMKDLADAFTGYKNVLAMEVTPAIIGFAEWMLGTAPSTEIFRSSIQSVTDAFISFGAVTINVAQGISLVWKSLVLSFNFFVGTMIAGLDLLTFRQIDFLEKWTGEMQKTLRAGWKELKQSGAEFGSGFMEGDLWGDRLRKRVEEARSSFAKETTDMAAKLLADRRAAAALGAGMEAITPEKKTAMGRDLSPAGVIRGTKEAYEAEYKARRAMQGGTDPAVQLQKQEVDGGKRREGILKNIEKKIGGAGLKLAPAGL